MQHAQGVASVKPVSAGVDEVCRAEGGPISLCELVDQLVSSETGVNTHICVPCDGVPTQAGRQASLPCEETHIHWLEGRLLLSPVEHSP